MGTYTLAELEVSAETYNEIKQKLEEAGYDHAFLDNGLINMKGIALKKGTENSNS